MAIYKCKMCGGDLEVAEGVTVVECDYCGTKQTVPTAHDEEIRNLFNRANLLRRKCEFDKAEELYEKILEKDEKQSEAYWCVLLCKYGIEYVEDPKTYKRVPTCHRTSFEAITSDEYYKLALKYADPVQKKIYADEAKYIDGVQKEILALSQKEVPYDVFICYKETDENGRRTEDSAIANDIYYQLTQEGYKVFYAAITLEDKLGSAYEPIIFAALHSSKVMLALGTKPEYFNAVWVKNEWSRFLKLMKADKTKQLIPCYRGMDAYELPEEFAHLQAQDMGKIGFINDLVRGIKKVISKEEPKKEAPKETGATAGVKSLLQRMYLFLEDEDWERATEYAEKVLDIDPQNAEAYLGELLAELEITKFENLYKNPEPIKNLPLFKKVYRFADNELKEKLDNTAAKNEKFREGKRQGDIYANAVAQEKSATTGQDFLKAARLFESISSYKDSAERAQQCREEAPRRAELAEEQRKEQLYQEACVNLQSGDLEKMLSAREAFKSIRSFRDSNERLTECENKIERLRLARKETIYTEACKALLTASNEVTSSRRKNVMESVSKARKDFEALGDFKDSKEKVAACDAKIAELKKIAEEKARQDAIIAAKQKKKKIIIGVVSGIIAVLVIIALIVAGAVVRNSAAEKEKAARAGMTYTISADGSHYIVSGIDKEEPLADYTIPASYHDLPVTEIGREAFEKSALKSITIPSTITKIGESAFADCTGLTKVNISDLVAWCRIDFEGEYASSNPLNYAEHLYLSGTEIKELVTPEGITEIKPYAFYGYTGLQKVTILDSVTQIGNRAFAACSNIQNVIIGNGVISIGASAFSDCDSLQSITVDAGNKNYSSQDGILYNKNKMEIEVVPQVITGSVVIPNGAATIEKNAFTGRSGLTNITIPQSVTAIGESAFKSCSGLKTVVWNASNCNKAGSQKEPIFADCTNLTTITLGKNVKGIPAYAFCDCGISNITIPDSVTTIGEGAFYGCSGISNVTIPDSVTTIGEGAFYGCNSLVDMTIPFVGTVKDNESNCRFTDLFKSGTRSYVPASLKKVIVMGGTIIGENAFEGCNGLTSIALPNSISIIGANAFSNCGELTTISIPNSVTSIGYAAFSNCSALKSIVIPDQVTKIDGDAFENCSGLKDVMIGISVASIFYSAFNGCTELESVTWNAESCKIDYGFLDGLFKDCSNLKTVIFGNNVKTIPAYAFAACSGLTTIMIPNSVTTIGTYAFSKCSGLQSVTIGSGVTLIGECAFYGCSNLKNAYFLDPNGWKYYYSSTSSSGMELKSSNLSNSATAAAHLTGYDNYEWRKG